MSSQNGRKSEVFPVAPNRSVGAESDPVRQHVIRIQHLEKRFGSLQVLKDLSLAIDAGRITAIVGPNGSGKTTFIKSILGLVRPDSGDIFIKNTELNGTFQYRKWIGYMPQIARFPENLKVKEILYLVKDLRGNPDHIDDELLEKFSLHQELDKSLYTLSGGTRQKVSAVLALLFDPEIIILDEPTAGLDPISSRYLKEKIHSEHRRGKSIILTSHIMSELEELAEDIAFLLEGRVVFHGPVAKLKAHVGEKNLENSIAQMMLGAAK